MAAPLAAKAAVTAAQSKGVWKLAAGVGIGVIALFLTPVLLIVFVVVIVAGPSNASCLTIGDVDGFTTEQTEYVKTVANVGTELGVSESGIHIAVSVMLVESGVRNLASHNVAGSETYPNDGFGSDLDSVGLFQQRPSAGWGSVKDLMDPEYAARAFFGGPSGPNNGSPRGLLDIAGWEAMEPGDAAQAVQVSAFPDRYSERMEQAQTLLGGVGIGQCAIGGTGELVGDKAYPVAKGSLATSYIGHEGVDFPLPQGTPIYSVADGVVTFTGPENLFGGQTIWIMHSGGVMTGYVHMHEGPRGIMVNVGDQVKAGQQIGEVGSTGYSFGPHLHFEVALDKPAGSTTGWSSGVAPYLWLKQNGIAPGILNDANGNVLVDDLRYTGMFNR